ncbi:hypothetical protein D3C79_1095550 [compost metagenome]
MARALGTWSLKTSMRKPSGNLMFSSEAAPCAVLAKTDSSAMMKRCMVETSGWVRASV